MASKTAVAERGVLQPPVCLRGCGLVVATYEGRQVRYALADAHLARALGELVQVVLAVDTAQPCVDDDQPAAATALEAGR